MKKIRLGLDLDGTMNKFVDAFRDDIHETYGKPLTEMPEPNNWNFYKNQWGYTSQEYVELMRDSVRRNKVFWNNKIEPYAKEIIEDIYRSGYEIYIVTARSFEGVEDLCVEATEHWLAAHEIPHHKLVVSNDKNNLGLDLLLDDAPHNIENAELHGTKGVIFDQLWNRHLEGDRVYGWISFRNYLKERYKK